MCLCGFQCDKTATCKIMVHIFMLTPYLASTHVTVGNLVGIGSFACHSHVKSSPNHRHIDCHKSISNQSTYVYFNFRFLRMRKAIQVKEVILYVPTWSYCQLTMWCWWILRSKLFIYDEEECIIVLQQEGSYISVRRTILSLKRMFCRAKIVRSTLIWWW